MLTERIFDTGEISINYAEGDTAGPPLVLLHGLTVHWASLQPLIPQLAESWHVYACDLRGHGKSSWAKSGYRIIDFVPDTTTFIEQYIDKPTVLLGFSTGAVVALAVTARLPKFISALILLEPVLFFRNTPFQIFQSTGAYKWITWVYETISSTHSLEEVTVKCKNFFPESDEKTVHNIATMIHRLDPNAIATWLTNQAFEGFDLPHTLQQVTCPTLLLYGEPDQGSLVRTEDLDFVRVNLPQSVAIQINDAGHSLDWQQSDKVLEHIMTFLQKA